MKGSSFTGPSIFLVGMMGAGKTTLGRRLAHETGREFIDLDREIERLTGVTVATIFEIEGEAGFRLRESQLLAEIALRPGLVVATGGGVVLHPLNRARLLSSRCVVYLHAEPGLIFARIRHDRSRPLLQVADPLARIRQLVTQRDPLYREVADLVVESGRDAAAIMNELKQLLPSPCRR
ncbi:MAG: shikimate kinase [Rhodocyclaceae bacterium]|uniref:shikimate kinase n=1 Tax=Sulfuricystis thermophila TaxID=2496847 RepID=UPI0024E01A2D|nr:shikimate kinase [Sulfuricystis thermophila]MDI6750244.1 shikimate kinase [Rhodocyclaceae bacterium]